MLYQYHGNDMEALRDAACTLLGAAPPPPLVPERLIVPNVGMAKWLRQGIAARLGVAANLRNDSPAVFLNALAATVLGDADTAGAAAWGKEQLAIRLMRVLPGLLDEPAFDPVRRYLDAVAPQRRLYALCRRLATLFDQYLLYRPRWLLAWETGTPARDCPLAGNEWQAALWRALVRQIGTAHPASTHGAARLDRLIARLGGGAPLPVALPERVIGFGLGALPPVFVEALAALATRTDVHLFQFNPCREYWYDIVSERTRARWQLLAPERAAHAETGNPLLASWGTLGRTGLLLLLDRDGGELRECFREPVARGVLGELQRDILLLQAPESPRPLAAADPSLVFAEAHSPLREVEALQDQLLALLASLPGLRPRDITVMAPDIGTYAGLINAVFTQSRHDPRHIPFSIADRDASAGNPVVQSFLHLLALPESRFAASAVLALLGVPALGARFGIDAEALEAIRARVRDSGIRWGLDERPGAHDAPGPARNSWRFGLERMLLGIALDEGVVFEGATPFEAGGQDAIDEVGRLAEFIDRLAHYAGSLAAPRAMDEWMALLRQLIADFYADTPESAADLAELHAAIATLAGLLEDAGYQGTLTREVLTDMLRQQLAAAEASHQFLRGGINFCQLTPLRSIPFRVVCLLGMNAEAFPRNTLAPAFDLMATAARPGDPSRRDDDRYLFLEALLSARDCLYISHVARDERSNEEREPAIPVCELRDYIDRHWAAADTASPAAAVLTRRHRLKPFHAGYFEPGGALFSYRHEWLPAARGEAAPAPFCPAPLPARAIAALTLAELLRFFRNPCQGFFHARLGVRFEEAEEMAADSEPFALDGLAAWALRDELLATALAGGDTGACALRFAAAGTLPHGQAGQLALDTQLAKSVALVATAEAWAALEPVSAEFTLDVAGTRLHGTVANLRGGALRQLSASKANGATRLQFWITHLCCCAAGLVAAPGELHHEDERVELPLVAPAAATECLADLLALYGEGLCRPLPLFPKSAWAFARQLRQKHDAEGAMAKARAAFEDGFGHRGEGSNVYIARAFTDVEAALGEEFAALAGRVFAPLLAAETGEPAS